MGERTRGDQPRALPQSRRGRVMSAPLPSHCSLRPRSQPAGRGSVRAASSPGAGAAHTCKTAREQVNVTDRALAFIVHILALWLDCYKNRDSR